MGKVAKNEITGARILTYDKKPMSSKYAENWERIFGKGKSETVQNDTRKSRITTK